MNESDHDLLDGDGNGIARPEEEVSYLPSNYSKAAQKSCGLEGLASAECELRKGQAYDSIFQLRSSILLLNLFIHIKKANISGNKYATHANAFLSTIRLERKEHMETYQLAYQALIRLGLDPTSELRKLREDDLWVKDAIHPPMQGESKQKDPWFWLVGKPEDVSPYHPKDGS